MIANERSRRLGPWRFYNSEKVEIVNNLENPPDDFDAQMAVMSRVTYTIYNENTELFSTVGILYLRLTGTPLAEGEAKPFSDFLEESRIAAVARITVQESRRNKGGSRESFYFLRSKLCETEEKLRALCASRKGKESAF